MFVALEFLHFFFQGPRCLFQLFGLKHMSTFPRILIRLLQALLRFETSGTLALGVRTLARYQCIDIERPSLYLREFRLGRSQVLVFVGCIVVTSHRGILKTRDAFAASCEVTISSSSPRIRAIARTTSVTRLGSLRLPLCGTGVTYGASVSERSMSSGAFFTTSS